MHVSLGAMARCLLLATTLCVGAVTAVSATTAAPPALTDSYIVLLDDSVADPAAVADEYLGDSAQPTFVYRHAVKGFAAPLTSTAVAALLVDPRVTSVELDGTMQASTTQATGPDYWNLDRIDQAARPTNGSFTYTSTGAGVTAYVIDSGIRFTHTQFGGRAVTGYDAIDGGAADDCNGHGTHVAGTVGGSSVGVAKTVSLIGVRVLDCNGNGATSGVIAGVDWVTGHHAAGSPAVANMSLGGGANTTLDAAVNNAINDGITFSVAAGNGDWRGRHQNACNYSPARVANAITIGATDKVDKKASFSNYGNCVDWFAPGVSILSSWHTGDTAGAFLDGTSMASPAVAGVAAQYLQLNPSASPASVRAALFALTTKAIVTNSLTTNNHLLFTNL
ncbi:MAG TPA: S8 family serine peptidase [Acidimicrobiales bacterium]|nr:S8 family serine peptidase [Acidimicrobiales bacterium]